MNRERDGLEYFETEDGSTTLYDADRDLHYRSTHGARTESRHVFVEGTELAVGDSEWRVLELGFGGAMNFCETVKSAVDADVERLAFHTVERDPVPDEFIVHPFEPARNLAREAMASLRDSGFSRVTVEGLDGRVSLTLHRRDWRELGEIDVRADAIYHDPFGPRANPGSWTRECFEWEAHHLDAGGILATYSAATAVRRAMFAAGLAVASAPGPGRKREITFAARSADLLAGHRLLSRERYLRSEDD